MEIRHADGKKRPREQISSATHAKFRRGPGPSLKAIKDKKEKGRAKQLEYVNSVAIRDAKRVYTWLQPSDGGALEAEGAERTRQFKQRDIVKAVDAGAASKAFDLSLPDLGPYHVSFTRNGRYLALGGAKGHLALLDWSRAYLATELQVRETTRDVCVLHNEQFFAAAQKKHVFIYDRRGIEVHACKEHTEPRVLDFLPHHFLLVSGNDAGVLTYQDTSHGGIAAQHRTKLGAVRVMRHNPWNAVMCVGHVNGRVTMWTPNMARPVVSMQCHLGPLRAVAVDGSGRYLVSAGADRQVHVWDIRKSYQRVHSYFSHSPASSIDVSQRGLLAVAYGSQLHVWKDALQTRQSAIYMRHALEGRVIASARFCPYEDVLALGHAGGVSTMLVPGAGEASFDSYVANPFQSAKERREAEVHGLLDKLQPDMIMLDPTEVGKIRKVPKEVQMERAQEAREANASRRKERSDKVASKTRMKGKNRAGMRHRKRQDNIIEERKGDVHARMREQGLSREGVRLRKAKEQAELAERLKTVPRALHRLHRKGAAS